VELKLIETVLLNYNYNVNGVTHQMVLDAYNANEAQFAADVGPYWGATAQCVSGLPQILKGYMILGDGDADVSTPNSVTARGSVGFVKLLLASLVPFGSLVPNSNLDLSKYSRMPEIFSKDGDAGRGWLYEL